MSIYRLYEYGEQSDFKSVEDAQEAVRACGGDFEAATLTVRGADIINEAGVTVGQMIELT